MGWLGYKSHFTETVSDPAGDDPDPGRAVLPNLVTDVQTTHAAVPDVAMTGVVHDRLEAAGLLRDEPEDARESGTGLNTPLAYRHRARHRPRGPPRSLARRSAAMPSSQSTNRDHHPQPPADAL